MSSAYKPDASSDTPANDDYVSRPGQKGEPVPVQPDKTSVDEPGSRENADSDEQLGTYLEIWHFP